MTEYKGQEGWEKALETMKEIKDFITNENIKIGEENDKLKEENKKLKEKNIQLVETLDGKNRYIDILKEKNIVNVEMVNNSSSYIEFLEEEIRNLKKKLEEIEKGVNDITSKKRITKIESKAGQLVDEITFHFKNGGYKNYGEGGGSRLQGFTLRPHEKIIKVKQYIDDNYKWKTNKFLGYRIDFETNQRRSYKVSSLIAWQEGWRRNENGLYFKPWNTDYNEKNHIIFNVSHGKDLVGLVFDNGKLVGIEEN
jgi:flagellar biosynthesis chaperone FliJ